MPAGLRLFADFLHPEVNAADRDVSFELAHHSLLHRGPALPNKLLASFLARDDLNPSVLVPSRRLMSPRTSFNPITPGVKCDFKEMMGCKGAVTGLTFPCPEQPKEWFCVARKNGGEKGVSGPFDDIEAAKKELNKEDGNEGNPQMICEMTVNGAKRDPRRIGSGKQKMSQEGNPDLKSFLGQPEDMNAMIAQCNENGPCIGVLKRNQVVTVTGNFPADDKGQILLKAGMKGKVVLVDLKGNAKISFNNGALKQWVKQRHFGKLVKDREQIVKSLFHKNGLKDPEWLHYWWPGKAGKGECNDLLDRNRGCWYPTLLKDDKKCLADKHCLMVDPLDGDQDYRLTCPSWIRNKDGERCEVPEGWQACPQRFTMKRHLPPTAALGGLETASVPDQFFSGIFGPPCGKDHTGKMIDSQCLEKGFNAEDPGDREALKHVGMYMDLGMNEWYRCTPWMRCEKYSIKEIYDPKLTNGKCGEETCREGDDCFVHEDFGTKKQEHKCMPHWNTFVIYDDSFLYAPENPQQAMA